MKDNSRTTFMISANFPIVCWTTTHLYNQKITNLRSSHKCSVEKVFLEISQNLQENTCARVSFLIKLQALGTNKHYCSQEEKFNFYF